MNCPKCNNLIERNKLKNPDEEISKSINISILKDELFQTKDEIRNFLSELNLLKSLNKKNTIKKPKEEKKEIPKKITNEPLKEIPKKKKTLEKKLVKVETKLIDKCKHFYGNYKPIFACCGNAYACYLCHNENENHKYEFSNKVICLICNTIYTQNSCPKCNVPQVFKRKKKQPDEFFK